MAGRIENGTVFKLTVLTAAIGAGTMGTAGAATISKAPAGFTPLVISSNSNSSTAFDTDGNGTMDFTISTGGATNGSITLGTSGASNAFSGFTGVYSYASPDNFVPVTSLKSNASGTTSNPISSTSNSQTSSRFSPDVPSYIEVATNVTYNGNNSIADGLIGYIMGTRSIVSGAGTSAEVDTFTVSDYGVIAATAVPEPSSLALLALGGAGVAALRRRRARSLHAA